MVWLNYAGVQPSGNQVGTFNGYDVWTGNVSSWKYVAYVKQANTALPTELAQFVKDAVNAKVSRPRRTSSGSSSVSSSGRAGTGSR